MDALQFNCHARPTLAATTAQLEFVINNKHTTVEFQPTINWVMGSTAKGSRVVSVLAPVQSAVPTELEFEITARNTDVIICGYGSASFVYVTQPLWSDGSTFMDITGHGPDQDLQGPGSLVLPQDVTCWFRARVIGAQNG